ncbi:dedicator of cytokinesis protein 3 [Geosmithia morbida]|uniref:Dedicator of cytokinesis protein 3 n=1 Tax=Geosmithia morbida TaxID=1094350 RepID=A0A9P4Z472_9HYPO|nr:dedicator of cytokinesis protein 3 [Geosmithia morbida]KAF4126329.1 dedicator of cytokinesis protein 3 [Geosmithia morbida]
MPWQPLPRIAFAVATYPFAPASPDDLPLEIGDELYVIEETPDGNWLRGYLVAPPSLLAGLTSVKGQTLEARVFSGIFPRSCVEVREMLGEPDEADDENNVYDTNDENNHYAKADNGDAENGMQPQLSPAKNGLVNGAGRKSTATARRSRKPLQEITNEIPVKLSVPVQRDPNAPRPPAPVPMLKVGDETPTSAEEPLIDEIGSCMREWHSTNLHELLLSGQYERLDQLSELISGLNFSRHQFLYNVLTAHEYEKLREKTVWDLVTVNKLCGGDVIVRDPTAHGRVLTGDDSPVEVTKLQSVMSLLDEPPQPVAEPSTLHHILLDVKAFAGSTNEETSLVFSLVSKTSCSKVVNISEPFSVDVSQGGTVGGLDQITQTSTLFADISPQDTGDGAAAEAEVYLVVKVVASRQISTPKPLSRTGTGGQTGYHRDAVQSPAGGKSSRMSMMFGSKAARSAVSRGVPNRMDPMSEKTPEQRPPTNGMDSRTQDGLPTPGSAGSKVAPPATHAAQRTVGVGILRVNSVLKHQEEAEHLVSIWSQSSSLVSEEKEGRDGWDPIIRELMDNPMAHFEKSRRGERLQILLKGFNHPDADALIKATPTLLSGVVKTNRMGFAGAPSKPRSDIYVTINSASLARQNLLSRFGGSATSMPGTISGVNFQVTVEVRRSSGERIDGCIFPSSNSSGLSTFKSVAVERGNSWVQTLRLSLQPEDVVSTHVVLYLSDVPNPPFAVAYIPLWDQQAFIRDGAHGLLLYRIDEHTSTAQPGPVGKGGYLSLPWTSRGRDERSVEVTGPLAIMLVETYLCSTKFSQDRVILDVLKWKDLPKDRVSATLKEFIFTPEIEIVKLLSDVLNGLFGILVEYSGNDEYEDLVFTALVKVLGIVHDRRFNLGPLVDYYAENQFNSPFATPCLVRSFTRLLENPAEPETARKLRSTLKVVRHILKFITHARGQQREKEAGIGIKSSTNGFKRHLRTIFKALDAMMRNSSPVLVGSQTLAVQHFHTWLPELTGLLTTEEILHIAIDFVDSCNDVKGKLVLYKLMLIINYSKLDVFSHPEQKSVLIANTVRWISPHWGHTHQINDQWRDQIRLCCSVLASQMDQLGHEIPDHIPKIIDSYLALLSVEHEPRNRLSLLFPSSYPFPSKPLSGELVHDEALAELSAILAAVSSRPAGMQLELADDDLTTMLENLLHVHLSILNGGGFPQNWLSVHICHHKSTMRTLRYISGIMLESFLPDPDDAESFNTELWKLFFTTLLKLVGSPSLALETFPEQKRRAVWKIAGDVREHGADLLRTTWEAIGWEPGTEEEKRFGLARMGGYQVQYVPALVGPIVELCLSVHEGLRRMAVQVLQTMIVSEWTLSEDLSIIQTEMIDCLDNFFKTKPLAESIIQKLFVSELLERFQPLSELPDEPLYTAVQELVGTVDEFLDLLTAVHNADSTNEATNLISQLRLMEFLRDMQKEEIFVRYVHQLAAFQAECRNHAEAGLALRLHADLYEWDPTRHTTPLSEPEFPAQTAFERKEKIYFAMIKHFEDGESWSNALTAYKELQVQYETNMFDFAKLARTQRAIATIYETISKSEKTTPKYFKVVFKGLGFPANVRDKEFIYEGALHERGSAFTDRMQEQYPNARIVTNGDEVDEVEGQYLIVSNVSPHKDLDHQVYQRSKVPPVIREFLLSSHPQTFSVIRRRITTGPVEEHHTDKMLLTTAEPFPTILRRSEIIAFDEIRLGARETALERIVRKTQELATLERRVSSPDGTDGEGDDESAALLVDAVNISVSPISESSVSSYRKLLPQPKSRRGSRKDSASGSGSDDGGAEEDDEEEDDEEPDLDPLENAIKMALIDHAMVLKRCLAVLLRASNGLYTEHQTELQKYFETTYAPEIAILSPPPPLLRQNGRDMAGHMSISPTWRKSSASPITAANHINNVRSTPTPPISSSAAASGADGVSKTEETAIMRPVSVVQPRNRRLSFMNKKRKPSGDNTAFVAEAARDSGAAAANNEAASTAAAPAGATHGLFPKETFYQRQQQRLQSRVPTSASAGASVGGGAPAADGMTRVASNKSMTWTLSNERRPSVASSTDNDDKPASSSKMGGVRKRLSMLKLGKKASKGGLFMGSLDEE